MNDKFRDLESSHFGQFAKHDNIYNVCDILLYDIV